MAGPAPLGDGQSSPLATARSSRPPVSRASTTGLPPLAIARTPRRPRTSSPRVGVPVNGGAAETGAKTAATGSQWILLREVSLREATELDFEEVLTLNLIRPNDQERVRSHQLAVSAEDLRKLTLPSEFEIIDLPCIDSSHWLEKQDCLKLGDEPTTWTWAVTPEKDSKIWQVSIYARLQLLFEQIIEMARCAPDLFECHWRLCNGMCRYVDPKTVSLEVNSVDIDGVGEASTPPQFALSLLPHQRRSLSWMMQRERNTDFFVCERRRDEPVQCRGSDLRVEVRLDLAFDIRGGVLCDVIGSGKTATMLALICATCKRLQASAIEDAALEGANDREDASSSKPTLVLCPANVHPHWLAECQKFCPHVLRILALHTVAELKRTSKASMMRSDVVLVPYELLLEPEYRDLETPAFGFTPRRSGSLGSAPIDSASAKNSTVSTPHMPETPRSGKPTPRRGSRHCEPGRALEEYSWHRVVFDEFHELCLENFTRDRSRNSGIYRSLQSLVADKRWGMSGTPDAFLASMSGATRCARYFRCELSARSAPNFAEHFFRQARVSLGVEVFNHVCEVDLTPAERAIYFHHLREHNIPSQIEWEQVTESADSIRALVQLCSHFISDDVRLAVDQETESEATESAEAKCKAMVEAKTGNAKKAYAAVIDLLEKIWKVGYRPQMLRRDVAYALDQKRTEVYRACSDKVDEYVAASRHSDGEVLKFKVKEIRDEFETQAKNITQQITNVAGGHFPAVLVDTCYAAGSMLQAPGLPCESNVQYYVESLRSHGGMLQDARRRLDEARQSLNFFVQMLEKLEEEAVVDCPVCLETVGVQGSFMLRCGHSICGDCGSKINSCPICRAPVRLDKDAVKLGAPRPPRPERAGRCSAKSKSKGSAKSRAKWGSKLRAVVETFEEIRESEPQAKVIVFAQWESLRQRLSLALTQNKIGHGLLQGNIFERTRALERFRKDEESSLLLLSLEDSASGTNLTEANHVFLLHPMLASSPEEAAAFEAQAIGRVRRLGQARPVHIWRFVTCDTVEAQLWELLRPAED